MADFKADSRKIFAGPAIKRLRRELGLTQVRMAEELGISTSYLNLIERNQRPLTAQLLLRLAETYDIDLKSLAGDEEQQAVAQLQEVFSDPVLAGADVMQQELRDLAAASPTAVQAISRLHRAYQDAMASANAMAEHFSDRDLDAPPAVNDDIHATGTALQFPVEEVRDHFHSKRNHFAEIDDAAEALYEDAKLHKDEPYFALRDYLKSAHNTNVRILPVDVMSATLRRYDQHNKTIYLSERLPYSARVFQLANRAFMLAHEGMIDAEVEASNLDPISAAPLFKIGLANYAAAALMMPYARFHNAAKTLRYDVEALCDRFSAGFEQVAHRLTTMQRRGDRGIPFFLIRVDTAGNVSKRFSAGGFHFARQGGTCPRWNLHEAFRLPGQIFTQAIQLPDGTSYFSISRTVDRVGGDTAIPNQQFVVGLGCELDHAHRLCYGDSMQLDNPKLTTPIGVTCRLCDRVDCTQRAFPPLNRRLTVHDHVRGVSPFTFSLD